MPLQKKFFTAITARQWVALLFTAIALYIGWEAYWYSKVSYQFIKWHTHMALILIPTAVLITAIYYFTPTRLKQYRGKFILLVSAVAAVWLLLESVLFIIAQFKGEPDYEGIYRVDKFNIYHIWKGGNTHTLQSSEFSYSRTTNSLGFSDVEWSKEKDSNTIRIVALGDSFTEGDGTAQDSAYPAMLKAILSKKYPSVEVMNAGTCGSDPFFNYKNLYDRLVAFKPDLVIQEINSLDVFENIDARGGLERFTSDSTITYKPAPEYGVFIRSSYLASVIDAIFNLPRFRPDEFKTEMDAQLRGLVPLYQKLAAEHNFKVVWVLQPMKGEVETEKYIYDYNELKNAVQQIHGTRTIELIPLYLTYIAAQNSTIDNYYWKDDGHHNADGYRMKAEIIAEAITPYMPKQLGRP